MGKKYEFTSNTKNEYGCTLTQIRALVDMPSINVKSGDLGGWVEKETNLSQEGNAWIYGNARICGNAEVFGNARVYGNARIYGNARVFGNAEVYGDAIVYGDAEVFGNARVSLRKKYKNGIFLFSTDDMDIAEKVTIIAQDNNPDFDSTRDFARIVAISPVIEEIEDKSEKIAITKTIEHLKEELKNLRNEIEKLEKASGLKKKEG